jgi:hypothetical protein
MTESITAVKDTSANPAPLGLLGFGMTTILLNIHNAGIYPLNSMIMGMGIFVGGTAQIIAGVLESKKNNTFGTTAFTAYGFFWLSLVAVWALPALGFASPSSPHAMGFYLLLWGLFTGAMFFGTLRMTRVHQLIFGSLTLLFVLLAVGDFTGSTGIKTLAGIEGIFCGFSAFYAAVALVLNEVYGRTVLPMGAAVK